MKRAIVILLVFAFLMPVSAAAAPAPAEDLGVRIPGGPEFWIKDVKRNESVTLKFADFPKGDTFHVYLGRVGNDFGSGYLMGTLKSNNENFTKTYKIPKPLVGQQHIAVLVWNKANNHHGYDIFVNEEGFDSNQEWSLYPVHRSSAQSPGKSVTIFTGPEISVSDVDYPNNFTLAVRNYFDKGTYAVYLGQNNASFEQILVGDITPRNLTYQNVTFRVPDSLQGYSELKVMVQNIHTSHSGSSAFTFKDDFTVVAPYGFFSDAFTNTGSGGSTGTPFTNIINVVANAEVTLQTFNFPADKEFTVSMGPMGTKGIGGYVVGTQLSGEGGSFIATYPIPAQLQGSEMIAIRLESTTSGHFAYDYFYNLDGYNANNKGVAVNNDWVLAAGTHPNTSIQSAVKDTSVTVSGSNFTRNDTYTVLMGPIGSQGVSGYVVAQYNTGSTGSFTATFNIPAALQGSSQIAIRFESNNSPYYAFDWFNNITFP